MDAQGRTVTVERSSFNSSNDAVDNNELPGQDCMASDCMDYEYTDNNSMIHYGSGNGDFLTNLHHHMIAGGSSSSYEQAAGNHAPAGVEGPSGGTGSSQASPSEPAIPSLFTVGDREEPMPQAPPVNNINQQPVNPGNDNMMPHPQLHAQQRFCNFLREMREDLERALETLDALQNIRCPLLSEDDDERVGTEEDADDEDNTEDGDEDDGEDEDEDEDEDMNVGEDDDLVGVHFQDDDDFDDFEEEEEEEDDDDGDAEEAEGQNGNEELGVMQEAPGNINDNVNLGPVANNIVAMQPEEGDGLHVDDILAALGMEVYEPPPQLQPQPQPQPQPDELHPHLVDAQPSSCSICLEDFEQGELLGILGCEHRFHYTCIQEWLRRKNSCPLCRNIGLAI